MTTSSLGSSTGLLPLTAISSAVFPWDPALIQPIFVDVSEPDNTRKICPRHDLAGFTRNASALAVNQAGINASTTCSQEYPPAKRRCANVNREENTSRVIAWQRCPKVF